MESIDAGQRCQREDIMIDGDEIGRDAVILKSLGTWEGGVWSMDFQLSIFISSFGSWNVLMRLGILSVH